ncbi:MAG: hypothetical protein K0S08_1615 [Gammaproteobacteria bacterium]|jgi:hypothetical protein|nr:hypothetical protein [Gammaproteobacteria bacterium]
MQNQNTLSKLITFVIVLLLALVFRLIPHIPNFSPQIVLAIYLASFLNKRELFFAVLLLMVIVDSIHGFAANYSAFGSWTFFTYTATLIISFASYASKISASRWTFVLAAILSSLGFWLWTNIESWGFSGMYEHSAQGFIKCYLLALPFLGYSLLAGVFWSVIIVASQKFLAKKNTFIGINSLISK